MLSFVLHDFLGFISSFIISFYTQLIFYLCECRDLDLLIWAFLDVFVSMYEFWILVNFCIPR